MVFNEKSKSENGDDTADEVDEDDFSNKCDECDLGMNDNEEHFERLIRGGAVGKLTETEALKKHWREYQRLCGIAAPLCPACNTHFGGFLKLFQHVVRRTDFEEGKSPPDVQDKEEKKAPAGVGRNKRRGRGPGQQNVDDDAKIPEDSSGHRDVLNLFVEFLSGLADDTVSKEYQQELLIQVICPRSNPLWDVLQLKKDGGEEQEKEEEEDEDQGGDESKEKDEKDKKEEKKDEKKSPIKPGTGTPMMRALFRCLTNGCHKEFVNLTEHLADIMLTPLPKPRSTASRKWGIDAQQEARANHWSVLLKGVKSPNFEDLKTSKYVTLCPVCGVHFRGGGRTALNGLLNHLAVGRQFLVQKEKTGFNNSAGPSMPQNLKNRYRVDRLTSGGPEMLQAHGDLAQWLLERMVDSLVGRSSAQELAREIWDKVVCEHGGCVLDLGDCGEVKMEASNKKREKNVASQMKKKEEKKEVKPGDKRPPPARGKDRDKGRDRRGGRDSAGSRRDTRDIPPKRARRTTPPPSLLRLGGFSDRARPYGLQGMGMNLQQMSATSSMSLPTYSAECSLCTTSFPARSQPEADRLLHQHLMDTLFGARVGRTGMNFPAHRYWHQLAPTSRRALCPQCNLECENLDALAQHLAVVIDGNNMSAKQIHIQAAQMIAEKFVDHMSGDLSVDGLRSFMSRFAAPENRLGAGFTGSATTASDRAGSSTSREFGVMDQQSELPSLSMDFETRRPLQEDFTSDAGFLGGASTQTTGYLDSRYSAASTGGGWTPISSTRRF